MLSSAAVVSVSGSPTLQLIALDLRCAQLCNAVSACMLSAFLCFTLVCFIRVWWTKHCAHKKRHKFHKFAQIIYALLLRFWYCRELCVFPGSELHKLLAARLRIVILHTQKIYTNDTVLNSKIWLTKRGIPSTIQTSQPWRKIEKMRDIFTPAVSIYFLRLGQATLCYWQEPGLTAKEPRPTKEPRPKYFRWNFLGHSQKEGQFFDTFRAIWWFFLSYAADPGTPPTCVALPESRNDFL